VQTGGYVLAFEVGIVGQEFVRAHAVSQQFEHVRDGDAKPTDGGTSATEAGDDRDARVSAGRTETELGGEVCASAIPVIRHGDHRDDRPTIPAFWW